MNDKTIGIACGALSAICYGLNPMGALFLYEDGLNVCSVLTYRFLLAAAILALVMMLKHETLRTTRRELRLTATLGILFGASALCLYDSYNYIQAGIASTLLFVYPVMVAVIMATMFREKVTMRVVTAIVLSMVGIALLYQGGDGLTLNAMGIGLAIMSALTYAVYIVIVNRSRTPMPVMRQTFYVLLFCAVTIVCSSVIVDGEALHPITTASSWGFVGMLAIVPGILSISLLAASVRRIGATPAAIMGALEPLTAVVIGISVFGEELTVRMSIGIALICCAVCACVGKRQKETATVATEAHKK